MISRTTCAGVASLAAALLFARGIALAEPAADPPEAMPEAAQDSLEIPADLADAVAFAKQRGRELYEHDQVAWHATDAAKPASRRWKRAIVAWITAPQENGARPLVRFLAEPAPGEFASRVDVIVKTTTTELVEHDPPEALPEDQQALARARALALRERKRQCTKRLNPVVLRDASGEIHVYLLAATDKPREVVLAGHDLARVRADGREILAWRPFSNSCMVDRAATGTKGLFVTHVLDPTPTEAHVFTSSNYRVPLFVGTERGVWAIANGEIWLIKRREESP